jgi:ketosteroid isomerase-like protein
MSQENVERLGAGLAAFNRTGEINPDFLAPDFEMHQASSIVDTAGVFRGPNGLRDALRELEEAFEELSFQAEGLIEAPEGEIVVFIRVKGRGRGSGIEIDNRIAWVWTFRDDRASRLVVYEERDEALEAVGLSG